MHWQTLDRALTGDGSELTLCQLGERYAMRVDGQELMNSASHGSEEKLAVFGCAGLAANRGRGSSIGGLGMGFTARAALGALAADAEVVVVEASRPWSRWNREDPRPPRRHAARGSAPVRRRRRRRRRDREGGPTAYDAILLDVDNGPSALTTFKNRRLYTVDGLRQAPARAPAGGVLAVWSTFQDATFTARLRAAGFAPARSASWRATAPAAVTS